MVLGVLACFALSVCCWAFVAIAVGKLAPADELPEELAAREVAPRVRHELAEIVRYDAFED